MVIKMNRILLVCIALGLAVSACADVATDDTKQPASMPGQLDGAGKGDWRTNFYTDFRGEVRTDDTRFDTYDPARGNYYQGYTVALEAGDTVDLRVGAVSRGFDAVMGVYGPQRPSGQWGGLIAANDDSPEGGTLNSYVRLEVEFTGNYLVLVREYNWNVGDLFVQVGCVAGACEDVCQPVLCDLYCEFGNQIDTDGCEVCACNAAASCQWVTPPANVRCAGIQTFAQNPDDNTCCEYPSPCNVPAEWETFSTAAACQGLAAEGEACSMYVTQCADGLVCEFQCPDGSNDPNCNLGINPSGFCAQPSVCQEGDTRPSDDGCNTCSCSGGQWLCTERACIQECTTDADCMETGCSGQLCRPQATISTCEYRPEYACYNAPTTNCGCNNGMCGWSQTAALAACLNN